MLKNLLRSNVYKLENNKVKIVVDAEGLLCPLPILKLRKALKECNDGDIVKLIANDPAASIDVPHFCNESGNNFIKDEVEKNFLDANLKNQKADLMAYYVEKRTKE